MSPKELELGSTLLFFMVMVEMLGSTLKGRGRGHGGEERIVALFFRTILLEDFSI
jgi:hypothetical protein